MNCSEFLELYSDYRDGRLESARVARSVREHLSECEACMRYDALICRGVMTLRSVNEQEPSEAVSLSGINLLPDSVDPVTPVPAKFAGGLMVAAAIALLFWPQPEKPVTAPPIAHADPNPPQVAVILPEPTPLPVRNIDPEPPVFHAQLQPRIEQVSFDEWVGVPD